MTKEEKKAIEYFKTYNWYVDINIQHKNVDILLNLIEKLQKENEELKEKNKTLELANTLRSYCKIEELANDFNYYKNLANAYQANSISKDKIRELFKELYMVKEIKFAKIKTTDNDKLYKFAKDIQKLLEEE